VNKAWPKAAYLPQAPAEQGRRAARLRQTVEMNDQVWFNFAAALGLGLLIGLERERSKGEGPFRRSAGIRTFALSTLGGAMAFHLGGTVLLATFSAATAALAVISYLRCLDEDPGLTTEVGLALAPLLGGLAMTDAALATGLGVAMAALFAGKAVVHDFVKRVLTQEELRDGLLLAAATFVVWPQLPDRNMGPFDALNPHTLWLVVILVLSIGAAAHVATRTVGARYGLPVTGLASGFVSSAATIGSMGGRAASQPSCMGAAVAGAALSTLSTFVEMAILLLVVSPPTLAALTPALAAGGVIAAIYGLAFTLISFGSETGGESPQGRAFNLWAGLVLAATMAVTLVVAAALKERIGEAGIVVSAGFAGFVDTHAAAVSIASLAAAETLTPSDAVTPILVAMSCNALTKAVVAGILGSFGFVLRVVPGLILSMGAAWLAASSHVLN
jgi:uncharacterized membrane protein (DUF4010 family)